MCCWMLIHREGDFYSIRRLQKQTPLCCSRVPFGATGPRRTSSTESASRVLQESSEVTWAPGNKQQQQHPEPRVARMRRAAVTPRPRHHHQIHCMLLDHPMELVDYSRTRSRAPPTARRCSTCPRLEPPAGVPLSSEITDTYQCVQEAE